MSIWNGKIVPDAAVAALPPSFKPKAQSAVPPSFKPKAPSTGDAVASGGWQGITAGFGDEGAGRGAMDASVSTDVMEGLRQYAPSLFGEPRGAPQKPLEQTYKDVRDSDRAANAAAEKAHPGAYGTTEMLGGLLSSAAVPMSGAVQGGLNAFGHAEGDAGQQALETAGGALFGKVLDAGGKYLGDKVKGGRLAKWMGQKAEAAAGDAVKAEELAREKAIKSAQGNINERSADIIRSRKILDENAGALASHAPDLAAAAKDAANDPAAIARLQKAVGNYIPRMGSSLDDLTEFEAQKAAAEAIDPAERAADKLANPIREAVTPRFKKHAWNKLVPAALSAGGALAGNAIGGDEHGGAGSAIGGGLGFGASLLGGSPGTVMQNMLKAPTFRHMVARGGQKAVEGAGSFVEGLARPAILEGTDNIQRLVDLAKRLRLSK
jgi:hypothetical protein